jgi:hypothetical protein
MSKIMTVTIKINDLCSDKEWLISHLRTKIMANGTINGLYAEVEKITIKSDEESAKIDPNHGYDLNHIEEVEKEIALEEKEA